MTTRTVVPAGVWVLRVSSVLFLLGVLAQAAFAGLFVTGDVGFLDMHSVNADAIAFSAAVWIVASLVMRAPRGFVIAGVIAVVITVAQIGIGYARILPLHIPLGVAIFATGMRLVQLAFSYRAEEK